MIIGTAKRVKEGSKPLPTRHFSKLQEDAVAKATGGRRSKNSGATMFDKSDVSTDKFNLECNNLTFYYNDIDLVLKKINLSINEGEKVLINCKSGSGKSTL